MHHPKEDLQLMAHRQVWRSCGTAQDGLRERETHKWQSNRKAGQVHKRTVTCPIHVPFINPLTIFRILNHQFFLSSFHSNHLPHPGLHKNKESLLGNNCEFRVIFQSSNLTLWMDVLTPKEICSSSLHRPCGYQICVICVYIESSIF